MAWKRLLILGAALLLAAACQAETRYVSDKLAVALLPKKDANSKLIKALTSGTALKVLDTSGDFSRVREPGGAEGWVESRYLTTDEPVSAQLAALQAAHQGTEKDLAAAREALDKAQARLARLAEQSVDDSASRRAVDEAELGSLRREREMLRERIAGAMEVLQGTRGTASRRADSAGIRVGDGSVSLPWPWLLGGAAAVLLSGFLWGTYWLDMRNRRRHGGFRL